MPIFPQEPVSDPQISPDGSRILFTYTTVNMKKDKYESHIWILQLEKSKPRQFTYSNGNETHPRWSPEGKKILFLSNRINEDEKAETEKLKAQLYVLLANGGEARQLTSMDEGVQRPEWSPDGRAIFFLSNVLKDERVEGSDVKIIRRIRYKTYKGNFIEGMRTHLFSVHLKNGKVRQLTDGEYDVETAVWSPDGNRIAFVSNMEEDADLSYFKNIYTISSKGGEPELLLKGRGSIGAIGWSPDGRNIAFTGRLIENPDLVFYKKNDIWVLPIEDSTPEGERVQNLTVDFRNTVIAGTSPPGAMKLLRWSPDSKYVYFKIDDCGGHHIYKVSKEGEVECVTKGKFTVGGFSLDVTGSLLAFTATDTMTPSELWIKDERGIRCVTKMNKKLLRKLKLREPEEYWFTASDGVKVHGWILKPFAIKDDEKYPTIIQIHGGPRFASYGYKLTAAEHEFQVLANYGFVVAYVNPRASTGYGESFAAKISGHYGERDYQDIMEAVDYIVKTYSFVDSERLGVAGGSYGGFMTNWILGHTDRFKAAVSMRSITNWYSCFGTCDVGWMDHEISWGKNPWDNLQVFMEKSPITYIDNFTTPLLLIHSEQDYRCPIEQAEQLFTGLKKLKRTVEFIRFPSESHDLSRTGSPNHRVERLQHILRWFDRYLLS